MQTHAGGKVAKVLRSLEFPHTNDDGQIHLKQGVSRLRLSPFQRLTPELEAAQLALKFSKEGLADLKQGSSHLRRFSLPLLRKKRSWSKERESGAGIPVTSSLSCGNISTCWHLRHKVTFLFPVKLCKNLPYFLSHTGHSLTKSSCLSLFLFLRSPVGMLIPMKFTGLPQPQPGGWVGPSHLSSLTTVHP